MNWIDHKLSIEIAVPREFNFFECLAFLNRSDKELLHQIKDDCLIKMLKIDDSLVLIKLTATRDRIRITFPIKTPSLRIREQIANYIWEWFDLESDLTPFYQWADQSELYRTLTQRYYGLRLIGIPNLFEAITWAIIGQQINLTFAYTIKARFIKQFGENLKFGSDCFWLFPSYERISVLNIADLKQLQFTTRKAEYVINIARMMDKGMLSKTALLNMDDYDQIKAFLLNIKGVGAWTADYVLMRCFHYPQAFPIADIGLHHALAMFVGTNHKMTTEEVLKIALDWQGYQGYITFYLWRSLYN